MAATAAAAVLQVGVLPTRASSEGAARRVFRVGFLAGGSGDGPSPRVQSFRERASGFGLLRGAKLRGRGSVCGWPSGADPSACSRTRGSQPGCDRGGHGPSRHCR